MDLAATLADNARWAAGSVYTPATRRPNSSFFLTQPEAAGVC